MDTIKNVTQLFIGKDPSRGAVVDEVINVYTQLADGEIVLTNPANVVLNNTTTAAEAALGFKFIQRSGTKLIHSDIVLPYMVRHYNLTATAKETQQLDFVGSNGTTGSIGTVASNIYTIRLNCLDKTTAGFMQQKIKEGFYKSNANATSYTQWAIAEGLVKSLIANYSRETEQDITFGVTNSGANVDLGTGAGTVTFTKGSIYAVFGTAIDDATANAILLVGDLLAATDAKTEAMYRVVAIDVPTETATLNIPWQAETVTIANATVGRVIGATAQAADYGVKLQGVDREFKAGYYWSNVNFWDTQVDFGALAGEILITTTAAFPGNGTGQYVANLEGELQADEFIYRGFPEAGVVNRTDGIGTTWYDVCIIEHKHNLEAAQGTPTESPKSIMIAWDVDVNGDGTLVSNSMEADALGLLALDQIIVTLWGIGSAQVGNVT
jgi:hypothetical protein